MPQGDDMLYAIPVDEVLQGAAWPLHCQVTLIETDSVKLPMSIAKAASVSAPTRWCRQSAP